MDKQLPDYQKLGISGKLKNITIEQFKLNLFMISCHIRVELKESVNQIIERKK